jgi:hypothetical protein
MIATSCYDRSRPGVPIDRDHPFRAIATSLWNSVSFIPEYVANTHGWNAID